MKINEIVGGRKLESIFLWYYFPNELNIKLIIRFTKQLNNFQMNAY